MARRKKTAATAVETPTAETTQPVMGTEVKSQGETTRPVMGTEVRTEVKSQGETTRPAKPADKPTMIANVRMEDTGATDILDGLEEIKPDTREELERLEEIFRYGEDQHRAAIVALRDIRERKLYRWSAYSKDEKGNKTFDQYMAQKWGHTRQWATQQINRLRVIELLEERIGAAVPQMPVDAADKFTRLEDFPEEFVAAYIEARTTGKGKVTEETAKDAVDFYKGYLDWLGKFAKDDDEGKAFKALGSVPTHLEYRALHHLGKNNRLGNLGVLAAKDGQTMIEYAKAKGELPTDLALLQTFRGDELSKAVLELAEVIMAKEVQKKTAEKLKNLKAILMPSAARVIVKDVAKPEEAETEADDQEGAEDEVPDNPFWHYEEAASNVYDVDYALAWLADNLPLDWFSMEWEKNHQFWSKTEEGAIHNGWKATMDRMERSIAKIKAKMAAVKRVTPVDAAAEVGATD